MARDLLLNAETSARKGGLEGQMVIDTDVHHLAVIQFLAPYVDEPWRDAIRLGRLDEVIPQATGDRGMAGRIQRPAYAGYTVKGVQELTGRPPEPVRALVEAVTRIGVTYSIVFPNDLLNLGLHPQPGFEAAVALGYARWVTEEVLPYEPRIGTLLYLPFGDPEASLAIIEQFAGKPGILGFLVTTDRHSPLHRDAYMRVYAALEERGLPLGFHGGGNWSDQPFPVFDSFLAAHAMSFPTYNSLHLINLILSGIPERFPKLRIAFFEAGAAWLPMLMGRLDTAFMMRPSEAPLLKRRPSEYMREFFYTIQPIETPDRPDQMRMIFDLIGRRQIMFATDYPHWDFDMPNSIFDLGFLSDEDKRDILALNAVRAFDLDAEALGKLVARPAVGARP